MSYSKERPTGAFCVSGIQKTNPKENSNVDETTD